MKRMTLILTLAFLCAALFPAFLMAQPPRPHSSRVPQGRPAPHSNMQVHVPQQHRPHYQAPRVVAPHGSYHHAGHCHTPYYRPHGYYAVSSAVSGVVPHGVVVVPQVVPPYPYYYAPARSGVSLTIGGTHGAVSVYSGY